MEDYIVDTMRVEDIEDVVEIETLSFKTPWSVNAFTLELTNNKNALYRVIRCDNRVIAYGGMWLLFDEVHITNIAVHPDYRGRGYGNIIVEDMMKIAKESNMSAMTLEVRVSNTPAVNLYKKYGFVGVATRKGYYQDTGEDALIMWNYEIQN
ncbi:MAG: ribosomal protein S18-alanine N-acetyltransferase [Clostridium sp.]